MALTITEQNGIFNIEGSIINTTSKYFKIHMSEILKKYNKVTINIDKVSQIDEAGLSVLRYFHISSLMKYNRAFYIVGNGCKEIYDDFRFNKVA